MTNATNWRAMKADRDAWSAAYSQLQAQRQAEAKEAARAVSDATTTKSQASSDAFDQGVIVAQASVLCDQIRRRRCRCNGRGHRSNIPERRYSERPDRVQTGVI